MTTTTTLPIVERVLRRERVPATTFLNAREWVRAMPHLIELVGRASIPSKITGCIVEDVPVTVTHFIAWHRAWTDKCFGNKPVNANVGTLAVGVEIHGRVLGAPLLPS